MAAYLDEYNPSARHGSSNGVLSDAHRLIFPNVKSCIAVVLLSNGGLKMTGVHLTVLSMRKEGELDTVIQQLRQEVGKSPCEAYLVSTWAHYAHTDLQRKLSKLARGVHRADVPPNAAGEADVDARFDLAAGHMTALVRQRVVAPPGSGNVTDGDVAGKPWMPISFQRAG